jgi:hypothetical protein
MVLSEGDGLPLASRHGIAAMILLRMEDGTISERRNDLFPSSTHAEHNAHEEHSDEVEGLVE